MESNESHNKAKVSTVRPRFSIASCLWITVAAAAFCAGWLMPSPIERPQWEPVLVADRDLERFSRLSADDVRIELRLASSIPQDAARDLSRVDGWRLSNDVEKHAFIRLDDFSNSFLHGSPPPGYTVVNIRVDGPSNQLLLALLQRGDKVSIMQKPEGKPSEAFINSARVYVRGTFSDSSFSGLLGLLVTKADKQKIIQARQSDEEFIVGLPQESDDQ